jgi:hypothetical protein
MVGLSMRQIFFLILLVVTIYAGTQFIPVYFRAYQFSDFVYSEVKFAASNRKSVEKLRSEILDEARASEIPITGRDIKIVQHGPAFTLQIDYRIPVNLRFYQRVIAFHVNDSGTLFDYDSN